MIKKIIFGIFIGASLIQGCIEPPDYPDEPVIEFLEVNRTQIVAQTSPAIPNRALDTLIIKFGFTDGDGDLGRTDGENVFLIDSRTGTVTESARIVELPQAGAVNGISGEVTIAIAETFCSLNSGVRDTMSYGIQVVDKAGNYSNIVRTPRIELICN